MTKNEISQNILHTIFEYRNDGHLFYKEGCGLFSGKQADIGDKELYRRVRLFGKSMHLHRLIFAYHHGHYPEIVDHIDGNTHNNKIENLREANTFQSTWNTKISKNNSTGAKGVYFDKITGKYRASIRHKGKVIRLGRFQSIDAASKAYEAVALELRGDYVRK